MSELQFRAQQINTEDSEHSSLPVVKLDNGSLSHSTDKTRLKGQKSQANYFAFCFLSQSFVFLACNNLSRYPATPNENLDILGMPFSIKLGE